MIQRDCLEILPDFMYDFLEEGDALDLHIYLLDHAAVPAEDRPVFWLRKEELSILDWLLFLAYASDNWRAIKVLRKIEKNIHDVYNAIIVPVAGRLEEEELMGLKSPQRTPMQNLEMVMRSLARVLNKQPTQTFALLFTETKGYDEKRVLNLFLHPLPVPEALTHALMGVYTTLSNARVDILFWMRQRNADVRI